MTEMKCSQILDVEYPKYKFSAEEEQKLLKMMNGDILQRLEMVKTCMDLVVKMARWFALENGVDFSEMVRTGIQAIIKFAETYDSSKCGSFGDYIAQKIATEMIKASSSNRLDS